MRTLGINLGIGNVLGQGRFGSSISLDFKSMSSGSTPSGFTFTRSTAATYWDADGLLKWAPHNLLLYSEQVDNANWTKSRCTISANAALAPDGTATADKLIENDDAATTATKRVYQPVAKPASAALQMTFAVSVKAAERTTCQVKIGDNTEAEYARVNVDLSTGALSSLTTLGFTGSSATIQDQGNGWYRVAITTTTNTASQAVPLVFIGTNVYDGDGISGIYMWGAQLNLGPTALLYMPTTSAARYDSMRISRDPVSGEMGYLAEPQRTNYALYSQDFSVVGTHPQANTTVTVAGTTAPDGTLTGNRIQATATSATTMRSHNNIPATSASYSVFVKKGTSATIGGSFSLRNVTTATDLIVATVNLDTGAIAYSTGSTGVAAIAVGNGWWRVSLSASSGITSGDAITGYSGARSAALTAGDHWFLWGDQLEAGSYPTSYIPTTSATVTRGADLLTHTLSGANASALSTAGTMVCRFSFLGGDSAADANSRGVASLDSGTTAERHLLYNRAGVVGSLLTDGSSDLAAFQFGSTVPTNTPVKLAHAFALNDTNAAKNGTAGTTDVGCTMPTVTTLYVGSQSGGASPLGGLIHSIGIYTSRLTDAQLQALTA